MSLFEPFNVSLWFNFKKGEFLIYFLLFLYFDNIFIVLFIARTIFTPTLSYKTKYMQKYIQIIILMLFLYMQLSYFIINRNFSLFSPLFFFISFFLSFPTPSVFLSFILSLCQKSHNLEKIVYEAFFFENYEIFEYKMPPKKEIKILMINFYQGLLD